MKRAGWIALAILSGLLAAAACMTLVIAIRPLRGPAVAVYGVLLILLLGWSIVRRRQSHTMGNRWLLTFCISWIASAVTLFVVFMALVILALKSFT